MNISGYSASRAQNRGQQVAANTPQINASSSILHALAQSGSAPQIAAGTGQNLDPNQYQDFLGQLLMSAMNGGVPSLAQTQLNQSQDKNLKQMLGAIGSMGGTNTGAMRNNILRMGGQNAADLAGQGAILRANENQMNQNLLAGLSGQVQQNNQFNAGQALNLAGTNLNSQSNYFSQMLNALMGGQQANQNAYLNAFNQGTNLANQEAQNNINNFNANAGAGMSLLSLFTGGR